MSAGEPTFLNDISGPDGLIDLNRLSRVLLVSRNELTAAVGLGLSDISTPEGWASPTVQARLSEVAQIMDCVLPWCGSPPRAYAWFRSQPIPSFGGQSAKDLVCAGRAAHVVSHLERIAEGGFA
jgi:hypothetical protein